MPEFIVILAWGRARQAQADKFAGQNAKRRKMREKLERDEMHNAASRSEEQVARERLHVSHVNLRMQVEWETAEMCGVLCSPSAFYSDMYQHPWSALGT